MKPDGLYEQVLDALHWHKDDTPQKALRRLMRAGHKREGGDGVMPKTLDGYIMPVSITHEYAKHLVRNTKWNDQPRHDEWPVILVNYRDKVFVIDGRRRLCKAITHKKTTKGLMVIVSSPDSEAQK